MVRRTGAGAGRPLRHGEAGQRRRAGYAAAVAFAAAAALVAARGPAGSPSRLPGRGLCAVALEGGAARSPSAPRPSQESPASESSTVEDWLSWRCSIDSWCVQREIKLIWVEYLAVVVLAYLSFGPIIRSVSRAEVRPSRMPSQIVHQVLVQVMVPVSGFLFAVFTERAASELKGRIDNIEKAMNREAAVLSVLIPKLSLLLQPHPQVCVAAFAYLEGHVGRMLGRLAMEPGPHRLKDVGDLHRADPGDVLWHAVSLVERTGLSNASMCPIRVELLRVVNDLLRDFFELRSRRFSEQAIPLPPQLWLMMGCFTLIFSFSFMWAVVDAAAREDARSDSRPMSRSPSQTLPGLQLTPPRDAGGRVVSVSRLPSIQSPALEQAAASRRLGLIWAMLVVSQFVVLQMCSDMRNPFEGQYRVDEHGVLREVFQGPIMTKIREARLQCEGL